ncbi:hypothetical protein IE077_001308 [Cardiosporidium cionae]|uniref:Uncharacterized protein n=1 Tax=Cardiosporidium cionae TaxID=476202 RepID=A0ABQ7J6E5_9APIC|nr:hypothetical protein IE077_001308 [Cardiosporidium cionae]|eukprot:KAF8819265.1 hypothetical protein IE077_001308 [Cardiosporidium cionae]
MSEFARAESDCITFTGFEDADALLVLPPSSLNGYARIVDLFEHLVSEGLDGDRIERTSILQGEILHFGIAFFRKKRAIDSCDMDNVGDWLKRYQQLVATVNFQFDDKECTKEKSCFSPINHSSEGTVEHLRIISVSAKSQPESVIEKHVYDETKFPIYCENHARSDEGKILKNRKPSFVLFTFAIPAEFDVDQIGRFLRMRVLFSLPLLKKYPKNNIIALGRSPTVPYSTFAVTQGASMYFTEQLRATLRAPTVFNSQIPWSSALTYRSNSFLINSGSLSSEFSNGNNGRSERKLEPCDHFSLRKRSNLTLELLSQAVSPIELSSTKNGHSIVTSSPRGYGIAQICLKAAAPLKICSQWHLSYVSLLFTNCTTDVTIQIKSLDVPEFEPLIVHELPFIIAPGETYGIVLKLQKLDTTLVDLKIGGVGSPMLPITDQVTKVSEEGGIKWNVEETGRADSFSPRSTPVTIAWGIDNFPHSKLWLQTSFKFVWHAVNLLEATVIGLHLDEKETATNVKICFMNNNSVDMELLIYYPDNIHFQRHIPSQFHSVGMCPSFIMLSFIEKIGLIPGGQSRSVDLRYIRTHSSSYELPPLFIVDTLSLQHFLFPGTMIPIL